MCVIGRRCQLGYQLSLNPLSCLLIRSSRFHITKRPKPQQLPHRLRTAKASLMSPTYRAVDIERPDAEPVRIAFVDHPSSSSHAPPKATILLIHGFPQTSYQFHHVLPLLAEKGYRCIAPITAAQAVPQSTILTSARRRWQPTWSPCSTG
jgi:hypothetical protein